MSETCTRRAGILARSPCTSRSLALSMARTPNESKRQTICGINRIIIYRGRGHCRLVHCTLQVERRSVIGSESKRFWRFACASRVMRYRTPSFNIYLVCNGQSRAVHATEQHRFDTHGCSRTRNRGAANRECIVPLLASARARGRKSAAPQEHCTNNFNPATEANVQGTAR